MIARPKMQERRCITTAEEQLKTGFVQRNSSWWISGGFSALKILFKEKKGTNCHFETTKNSTHFLVLSIGLLTIAQSDNSQGNHPCADSCPPINPT